tara:strand:- start:1 stop:156 length:156 start_codon:yes stop_codon:yes gene_type:complete
MIKIYKDDKCKWCGTNLDLCAPHHEGGNVFCCLMCAQEWRLSKEPIQKILS